MAVEDVAHEAVLLKMNVKKKKTLKRIGAKRETEIETVIEIEIATRGKR